MQGNEDFSIRVPDTALTSRCVKAVFMEKRRKFFVLIGKSDMPVNGLQISQPPIIEGGDRFDCDGASYDCVEKMAQFLCCPDVE